MSEPPIGFVIKAVDSFGSTWWLGPPMPNGCRMTMKRREYAEVFPTRSEAQIAIGNMPATMRRAPFAFSVDRAD